MLKMDHEVTQMVRVHPPGNMNVLSKFHRNHLLKCGPLVETRGKSIVFLLWIAYVIRKYRGNPGSGFQDMLFWIKVLDGHCHSRANNWIHSTDTDKTVCCVHGGF